MCIRDRALVVEQALLLIQLRQGGRQFILLVGQSGLLGCKLLALLIQRSLLLGQKRALLIQLGGLGFQHQKILIHAVAPVSYTHLDVYKRQLLLNAVTQSAELDSFPVGSEVYVGWNQRHAPLVPCASKEAV